MTRTLAAPPPGTALDFEAFARECYPPVLAYLLSRTRNREQARDLAQETFLQAYRSRDTFDSGAGGPLEWAMGIARNVSASAARRQGRHPRELPRLDAIAEGAWTGTPLEEAEDARLPALRQCLESVAGKSREILDLVYASGLAYAEIADRLRMGVSAVKVAACRARQALSDCIRRRLAARRDGR